jgi:hypothetical protein
MDLNSLGYREEPFIVQVFYGPDLGNNEGRHIVLQGEQKIIGVDNTIRKKGMDIRTGLQLEQMSTYLCLKRAWNLHT